MAKVKTYEKVLDLIIHGDWNFYGINECGATLEIVPVEVSVNSFGYIEIKYKNVGDSEIVEDPLVLSQEEYAVIFADVGCILNRKIVLDYNIEFYDEYCGEPSTHFNYIKWFE